MPDATPSALHRSVDGGEGAPPIRVVFAKGGLDAHERGAHAVVLGLREHGFEVIYMGLRRTADQIVQAAVQEDADVVGISSLSGGHRGFIKDVLAGLSKAGADPVVVAGGLIPEADQTELIAAGVSRIFGQGALVSDIAKYLEAEVGARRARSL
jgi:methylmalonyl-CoA mutase, C-terminal domain